MLALVLLAVSCTSSAGEPEPLLSRTMSNSAVTTSPDGEIEVEVGVTDTGEPVYRVSAGSVEVIGLSRLGLETSLGSLSGDLEFVDGGEAVTVVDAFHLPTGKQREAETTATIRTVRFESDAGVLGFEVDVWVSDDTAAFRSRVTGAPGGATDGTSITVEWERTSFAMPATGNSWLIPYDRPTRYTPAYEAFFTNGEPIDQPGSSDGGWGFPALFELRSDDDGGPWVLLTEAGLTADYAATRLGPETLDGEFVVSLPDQTEGNGFGSREPTATLPVTTPWRVATIGGLDTIVSTNAVRHLGGFDLADVAGPPTEPPAWIEPGRVSWSWWADHDSSRNAEAMAPYIEFAAEIGWEYSLIDANWNEIPDGELAELIDLADASGVGLFLWYNSGGPNNDVTEAPRDLMFDRDTRRAEFARIAELGIVGVKVDFFQSDKQESIDRYLQILEDAAEFELLVNVHGSTIPRGWERQFPNLMTMESVRGAETYTFDAGYAATAPSHNTILPFTRNVIGSMDYTPVIFSEEDSRGRLTTDGHELALSVVFESGLQHFVDTPDSYRAQPDEVVDFLATVPVVWDDTVLLAGRPGSHVALARRHGDAWYLGAINGTGEPIDVQLDWGGIDPGDIDPGGSDPAGSGDGWQVLCDAPDGGAGATLQPTDEPTAPTTLRLAPFGGCVGRTRAG